MRRGGIFDPACAERERAAVNLEKARQVLKAKLIEGFLPVVSEKMPAFCKAKCMALRWTTPLSVLMKGLIGRRAKSWRSGSAATPPSVSRRLWMGIIS